MSYPSQRTDLTEPPRRLTEAELAARFAAAYPELAGPGTDDPSGRVIYGGPPDPRIGPIPPLLPPEMMWRERAEQEAAQAAIPAEVRAAREMIEAEMRQQGRRF
jgi:hypothetical protein